VAPWYAYTSGILGLVIVGTLAYSTPRLGLVAAFTVFVAAQFLMGALVDHFGWMGAEVRPLNLARLVGMGLLLAGTWLITRS
jgi:transporter family-2 protein